MFHSHEKEITQRMLFALVNCSCVKLGAIFNDGITSFRVRTYLRMCKFDL